MTKLWQEFRADGKVNYCIDVLYWLRKVKGGYMDESGEGLSAEHAAAELQTQEDVGAAAAEAIFDDRETTKGGINKSRIEVGAAEVGVAQLMEQQEAINSSEGGSESGAGE